MFKYLKEIVLRQLFAFLLGVFISYLSWSLSENLTIFSTFLFFAYFIINQRALLFNMLLGYYLFSSRGLLFGTANYFENDYIAIIIWFSAAFITSSLWILIWSPLKKKRLYLFPILLILLIIPPVGFISWVNPIISSAILFPKLGFLGIILYILFIYILLIMSSRKRDLMQFIIVTTVLISTIALSHQYVKSSNNQITLHPINSNLIYKNKAIDFMGDYRRQKKLLSIVNKSPYNTILLHENALGNFNQNNMIIWKNMDKNKTILAGATIINKEIGGYDNALMEITHNSNKVIYKQRVPVPITMWRPWNEQGANAYPFQTPTIRYKDNRVGVFICYEQLLSYPYLFTMLNHPNYIIGVSNLWWIKDKSIRKIQLRSMKLWGLLFNTPSISSTNL